MPLATLAQCQFAPAATRLDAGDLLCLFACLHLARRAFQAKEELSPATQVMLIGFSLLWFAPDVRLAFCTLTVSAVALLWSRPQKFAARSAWLWVALSVHGLWGVIALKLTSPILMPLETDLIGLAARVFGFEAAVHGTRIDGAHGWYIYVLEGCSSLNSISLNLLIWVSALALSDTTATRRAGLMFAISITLTIFANTFRIFLMSRSQLYYETWHNGSGAFVFSLLVTAIACLPLFR